MTTRWVRPICSSAMARAPPLAFTFATIRRGPSMTAPVALSRTVMCRSGWRGCRPRLARLLGQRMEAVSTISTVTRGPCFMSMVPARNPVGQDRGDLLCGSPGGSPRQTMSAMGRKGVRLGDGQAVRHGDVHRLDCVERRNKRCPEVEKVSARPGAARVTGRIAPQAERAATSAPAARERDTASRLNLTGLTAIQARRVWHKLGQIVLFRRAKLVLNRRKAPFPTGCGTVFVARVVSANKPAKSPERS